MLEVVTLHRVSKTPASVLGPAARDTIDAQQLQKYLELRQDWAPGWDGNALRIGLGFGKRSFLPTFDDGYHDTLTEALPILERFEVPFIIFLTTGFIDRDVQPYESELASVLCAHERLELPDCDAPLELESLEARQQAYEKLRRQLKYETPAGRELWMRLLAEANRYARREHHADEFLTWEEVIKLDRHPLVTIGAHSCDHPVLPALPIGQAFKEILRSKRRIEKVVGHQVKCFSYPYGAHSGRERQIVARVRFAYAFTTRQRRVRFLGAQNPFAIPRVDINTVLDRCR